MVLGLQLYPILQVLVQVRVGCERFICVLLPNVELCWGRWGFSAHWIQLLGESLHCVGFGGEGELLAVD